MYYPSYFLSLQGYLHLCQIDGSTCSPLNYDLRKVKIAVDVFNLICGMLSRVGSTCR